MNLYLQAPGAILKIEFAGKKHSLSNAEETLKQKRSAHKGIKS
jgi:hypothetical protein